MSLAADTPAAVTLSWQYAVVLAGLVALAAAVSAFGRFGVTRSILTASARAVVRLPLSHSSSWWCCGRGG